MPDSNTERNTDRRRPRIPLRVLALVLLVVVAAAGGGIYTGNLLVKKRADKREFARQDEYVGLGEHTGFTGELDLQVNTMDLSVRSGEPARVTLTLTNKTGKAMILNSWLDPIPEHFRSNQMPVKVSVTRNGRLIRHIGNAVLFPEHEKSDFFALKPGKSKSFSVDILQTAGGGKWDMSAPGEYKVELWYENYITGRYIGARAWTGMTNHAVVKVNVRK